MTGVHYNGKTDIGRQREDNQDAFIAADISFMGRRAVLLSAIDGVGGYAGGDIAANLASDTVKSYLDGYALQVPELGLEQALISANNRINRYASEKQEYGSMGCVASVCVIDDTYTLYFAHLGDSRIYIYQDGQLTKITHDHSPVGTMEDEGELSELEAMAHPDRNIIFRMLGHALHRFGDGFIEHGTIQLNGACQVLLCSDGLTDQLRSAEIKAVLDENTTADDKVHKLVEAANEKGGKDNVTVVLAEVKASEKEEAPVNMLERQREDIKSNRNMNSNSKVAGFLAMLVITLGVLFGFYMLYRNQQPLLGETNKSYAEGRAVNLDKDLPAHTLESMLYQGGFFPDANDAKCVARHTTRVLADNQYSIKRLGELNLWAYQIPAFTAKYSGGSALAALADTSFSKIGVTPDVAAMYAKDSIPAYSTTGKAVIEVKVIDAESHNAVPGTIVRLKEHFYEEVVVDSLKREFATVARDTVAAYAKTDSLGYARFDATEGKSYSVLPIKPGFQYGKEKGTVGSVLKARKTTYVFNEREHRIRMFPGSSYSEIKSSTSITVRTPEEYTDKMLISILLFLVFWWAAFISVIIRDNKLRQKSESIIIPILMFISGVGILAQFSMLNPLTDRLLGFDTACTIALAIVAFIILQRLDIVRWYASDYQIMKRGRVLFDPLMGGTYRPFGITYLVISIGLLILLAFFGASPEGSDARISLFGWFQPADLCKFLIVIFMAAFFAAREDEIRAFSASMNKVSIRLQIRIIALVCISILVICGLYLTVLSDLGAGLICLLVFICMYSCARDDLWQMIIGVITYLVAILLAKSYFTSALAIALASVIWLTGWLAFSFITKRRVYESAIFFNLLVFILVAGGPIFKSFPLTEHQGQKLIERNAMTFSGVWENQVEGVGDQVFLAIKSISSGGMFGQGLGAGHPNLTPAFTTDMCVAGISEQMGYVMIIALMIAYMLLAYYGMKSATKSGHSFVYYLVAGITLATILQWIVMVGATSGVFCLTGIPAPFLAFGKSSLLFHIIAYSLVIAASRYPCGFFRPVYYKTLRNRMAILPVLLILALGLTAYGMRFACFERDRTITRPGVFINSDGELSSEYDPRINIILDKIEAGDIYDRNGVLLATSLREKLEAYQKEYSACGISVSMIDKEMRKNQRRYYPFGNHFSFVLGNYNNKSLWSNSKSSPYGLGVENRFFSWLRGFDSTKKDMYGNESHKTVTYQSKPADRFLPEKRYLITATVPLFDYAPIVDLIKDGENGAATKAWNAERENRDITLTFDAKLQTITQTRMAEYIEKDPTLSAKNKLIATVVIQEVRRGDVLASANYPLPNLDTILFLNSIKKYRYDESDPNSKAITLRDGGITQSPCGSTGKTFTALAGMMAHGKAVCDKTYFVNPEEIIERGRVNEPNNHYVSFEEAIRVSSNCYFIHFGLDNDVFSQLGTLYKTVGVRLDGHETRGKMVPYVFDMDEITPELDEAYDKEVEYVRDKAISLYHTYLQQRATDGKKYRFNAFRGSGEWWGWFYGQSTMQASPLNMARTISIIAQDGKFVPSRYVLKYGDNDAHMAEAIDIVSGGTGKLLDAMCSEAQKHRVKGFNLPAGIDGVGSFFSKTGTPERGLYSKDSDGNLVYSKPNDGWYIFGLPCATTNSYLAVAIRLQRLGGDGSSQAVKFASEVIIPAIKECGYQID